MVVEDGGDNDPIESQMISELDDVVESNTKSDEAVSTDGIDGKEKIQIDQQKKLV